jgi:hypothetical protein
VKARICYLYLGLVLSSCIILAEYAFPSYLTKSSNLFINFLEINNGEETRQLIHMVSVLIKPVIRQDFCETTGDETADSCL